MQDINRHEVDHILERLRLAPNELLLLGRLRIPGFDHSTSIFVTSSTQLSKGKRPCDGVRGPADATTRLHLVPVEDLLPQIVEREELCIDPPCRAPELGEVLVQVRTILETKNG